ncbi:MAG TPA: hypothetical protein VMV69_29740 [Pirellulales bacterium]|nr:hypothetical protein [Pirellulales bacterium]
MRWVEAILDELSEATSWSYRLGAPPATEPAATAALALAGHGRREAAERACRWLVSLQSDDGTLGISATEPAPHWPTGMAMLAWRAIGGTADYETPMTKGLAWMLATRGETLPRSDDIGHDTTAIGWPWVEGTHAWVEPTAFNLLALKAVGHAGHPRARWAAGLLVDRLLPSGGCNYGNTVILGQTLRAHVEPTGLALAALAGEADPTGRIMRSMDYLSQTLDRSTTAASLAYGLMGLAAHGRVPIAASEWLASAAERTRRRGASPHRLALLALAALGTACPLFHGTDG